MRWLDGIVDPVDKFEQTLEDSEGQGRLVCCSPWGHKESDMTAGLNNNKEIQVARNKPTQEGKAPKLRQR